MGRVMKTLLTYVVVVLVLILIPKPNHISAHLPKNSEAGSTHNSCIFSDANFTLTLITGDRLYLTRKKNNEWEVFIDPAGRENKKVSFMWHREDALDFQLIPVGIRSLIGNGLDPLFFDIDYLIDNSLDDSHMKFIPVIVKTDEYLKLKETTEKRGFNAVSLPLIKSTAVFIPKDYLRTNPDTLWTREDNNLKFAGWPILHMRLDRLYHVLLDEVIDEIGSDTGYHDHGVTGKGVNVAVLDTGVDSGHPDFSLANGVSKITVKKDLTCQITSDPFFCDGTPEDLHGHGTAVAGIALGSGVASSGKYKGIAPSARLINIKVLNRFGFGLESSILAGLERAIFGENKVRGDEPFLEADIISLSFGGDSSFKREDPLASTLNELIEAYDIPIIVAAGNSEQINFSVKSPGTSKKAITVGRGGKIFPEMMDRYLEKELNMVTHKISPDIIAPGKGIMSACSSMASQLSCPQGKPYTEVTGSSMSTAVISGSVALLFEKARMEGINEKASHIKDLLISSSDALGGSVKLSEKEIVGHDGLGHLKVDRSLAPGLLISPAQESFGYISKKNHIVEKKFKIQNFGKETKQISLKCYMEKMVVSEKAKEMIIKPSHISLIPSTMTLGPGATATLTLSVDMEMISSIYGRGVYNGHILGVDRKGEFTRANFDFIHEGFIQQIDIHGFKANGKPAASALLYINCVERSEEKGSQTSSYQLDESGYLQLKVPPGLYNLILSIWEQDVMGETVLYRISHMEQTVGKKAVNVIFDAQKARPVTLNLSADPLATECLHQSSDYFYYHPGDATFSAGWFITGGGFDKLLVHSNKTVSKGKMLVNNRWLKTQNPAETSKVLYDWIATRNNDIPYDLNVSLRDLSSAGIGAVTYHSDMPKTAGFGRLSRVADRPEFIYSSVSGIHPLKVPILRREYYVPEIATYSSVMWANPKKPFHFKNLDETESNDILISGKKWGAGEMRIERWTERPLHPSLVSIAREENRLMIKGHSLVDPFGHGGVFAAEEIDFNIYLYIDDELIAFQPDFNKEIELDIPEQDALIKIRMEFKADSDWSNPPLHAETQLSFKSALISNKVVPIPRINYYLKNLNMNNQVESDGHLSIRIELTSPEAAKSLLSKGTLTLSTDGGKSWFLPDSVKKSPKEFQIETKMPSFEEDEMTVSIKFEALTLRGIKIKETIKNAFILKKTVKP